MIRKTLFGAVCLFGAFAACAVQADIALKFGVYATERPTALAKRFNPVLKAIEKNMGAELGEKVTVKLKISKTYEGGVDNLVQRKVDFARFGAASYVSAKEKAPGVSILAMESKKGKKVFSGVICVAANSRIKSAAELKGKSFAFGNESSTIGRYVSQRYLLGSGVKAKDLATYKYLGRHDKVGMAVASGEYDAGALKESTYKKLINKGSALRKIADFPVVTKPWIAREGLPDRVRQALSNALLAVDDAEVLKGLKKAGFVSGDDSDFATIRDAIQSNDQFFL